MTGCSDTPEPVEGGVRERLAQIAALHGLGTIMGKDMRDPPHEGWDRDEWTRRILECIPQQAEQKCYALADAILAVTEPLIANARAEATEAAAKQSGEVE